MSTSPSVIGGGAAEPLTSPGISAWTSYRYDCQAKVVRLLALRLACHARVRLAHSLLTLRCLHLGGSDWDTANRGRRRVGPATAATL
jgi:hypothetical protein